MGFFWSQQGTVLGCWFFLKKTIALQTVFIKDSDDFWQFLLLWDQRSYKREFKATWKFVLQQVLGDGGGFFFDVFSVVKLHFEVIQLATLPSTSLCLHTSSTATHAHKPAQSVLHTTPSHHSQLSPVNSTLVCYPCDTRHFSHTFLQYRSRLDPFEDSLLSCVDRKNTL